MASGIQTTVSEIREQAAFSDGADAAFKALREIYDMPVETRNFLFGEAGLSSLVHKYTPDEIFTILNNKDSLLSQRLEVGDIVKNKMGNNIMVLWVAKDQIHFDGVWDDGPDRGRTISNKTLKELGVKKDTDYDKQDIYCLKVKKYDWE